MLCRCCGLCSLRNGKINIVWGGRGRNVSKTLENRILLRSVSTLLSLIVDSSLPHHNLKMVCCTITKRMWPWLERLYILSAHLSKFPVLSSWCAAMSDLPAVEEDSYPAEWHKKFQEGYFAGKPESQLEEKA